jgi:hypothetical protein
MNLNKRIATERKILHTGQLHDGCHNVATVQSSGAPEFITFCVGFVLLSLPFSM